MLKLFGFISRVIVGLTFVFSGFVKAVDPVGGAVKFNDYFQAFGMEWMMSLSQPLAVALAAFEFMLGMLRVFTTFPTLMARLAFIFMGFFTLLALGLALFIPVSDCGCFGDAIILTNWQTFWKNVVIMVFATHLVIISNKLVSPYSIPRQSAFALLMLAYITGIAIYSLRHLPLIDFRPYAIGKHLPSGMSIPEDASPPEFETTFVLEKEGRQQTFTVDNYPYEDTTWTFVTSETKMIKEGYQPPIHDFLLQHPQDGDITEQLVQQQEPLLLMISPDVSKISPKVALQMAELSAVQTRFNNPFYLVTSSPPEVTGAFERAHKTSFTFLQGDETNLKTIIRSNPGLLLINNGTVTGKWHFRDFPTPEQLKHPLSTALLQNQKNKTRLMIWGHLFLLILVATITLKSIKTKSKAK